MWQQIDKLANRGSVQARAIMTNARDFIVNLWHNLRPGGEEPLHD